MAGTTGLEPATSAVTGQRSNQLSYVPKIVFTTWIMSHRIKRFAAFARFAPLYPCRCFGLTRAFLETTWIPIEHYNDFQSLPDFGVQATLSSDFAERATNYMTICHCYLPAAKTRNCECGRVTPQGTVICFKHSHIFLDHHRRSKIL